MAVYNNVVVTDAGIALLRNVSLLNRALNASRVVTSASVVSNPQTATTIPNVVQNQPFSLYPHGTNQFVLEAQLTNAGVAAAYNLNTIGFYANDGVTGDVLLAVITAQTPDLIPPASSYPINLNFRAFIALDSGGNVTINASFAGYATMETLGEHMTANVEGEDGVHGIRYFEGALQVWNGDEWEDVAITDKYRVYGVSVDLTNPNPETAVTYTDDAASMTGGNAAWDTMPIFKDIKPCMLKNGQVQYYLNPSNFAQKADGTAADITSGNDGDVMIEIPKCGLKINTTNNTLTIKVTDDPANPEFRYYAHTRDTEGDRNKLYIAAYKAYDDGTKLRSLSGKAPTANQNIGWFRTHAQANGAGYDQMSFYPLTLIQALFLIRFKNRDSQTALGRGFVDGNSAAINTGGTNAKGMFFGEGTGQLQMKCFGLEDLWGNVYNWIDGLYSTATRNIMTAFKNFNDTGSGYTDRGQGAAADIGNYMSKPQGTTETGFIAKEVTGSATTHFADYASLYADRLPVFGGIWTIASNAGVFRLSVNYSASNVSASVGGRLMFL